ncbi:hypothetical protein H0X48_02835 [Candidatus Dependentiae bacterium]|nr:hypothetical protein [Candidatus Dependentiae bacterium]
MKKYIYLLALTTTLCSHGMDYTKNFFIFGSESANQIYYDQQLKDAVAGGIFEPANISLAINALQGGANPNRIVHDSSRPEGFILLNLIINTNRLEHRPLFDALIDAHVDVNLPDKFGVSPLAFVVDKLIDLEAIDRGVGAYIEEKNNRIHYIMRLLKAGARITDYMHPRHKQKILYKVISHESKTMEPVLEAMIAVPGSSSIVDPQYNTPLYWAAYVGNKKAVELLLQAGAPVLIKENNDWAILSAALRPCNRGGRVAPETIEPKQEVAEFLKEIIAYRCLKNRTLLVKLLQSDNKEAKADHVSKLPADILNLIAQHTFN